MHRFGYASNTDWNDMVVAFKVKMISYRRSWMGKRGEFNELVRSSLRDVAALWIAQFLPRHFTNQAISLYRYAFRKPRYVERKRRLRPELIPPAPFQFRGTLMDYVMANAQSGQMLSASKAVATWSTSKNPSGKSQIKIPVRIPHPIHPKNRGELTRLAPSEIREMRRTFFDSLGSRLKASNKVREEAKIA